MGRCITRDVALTSSEPFRRTSKRRHSDMRYMRYTSVFRINDFETRKFENNDSDKFRIVNVNSEHFKVEIIQSRKLS